MLFRSLYISIGIFGIIALYALLVKPEIGVLLIFLGLPFLPTMGLAYFIILVAGCYFLKFVRGKRSFSFEIIDASILAFCVILFAGGFVSVSGGSIKPAVLYLCFTCSYFLFVNLIKTAGIVSIPYLFIIALAIGAYMWFLFNKTRYGKYMYALGGNEAAAEVSGINTNSVKLRIYTLAAFMYGLAGFLLTARAGGASTGLGAGYELEAIAACTIGGVSTTGGVGKVSGILIGVLVFELLKSALQFMNVNPNYQYVVQGLVIVVAVAFDIRKYIAKK